MNRDMEAAIDPMDIASHPLVTLNRIPAAEVKRMAEKPRLLPRKGKLEWDQIPGRVIVDEGEDVHIFGMIFTAFCGVVGMLAGIGLAALGAFVLAQALRHAIDAGGSWAAIVQALRAQLG